MTEVVKTGDGSAFQSYEMRSRPLVLLNENFIIGIVRWLAQAFVDHAKEERKVYVKGVRMLGLQTVLLIIGTVLIVIGVIRGEAGTVFAKAIRICLECIGIG